MANFNWQLERHCLGMNVNADLAVMLIKEGNAAIFVQLIWRIAIQAGTEVLPFISSGKLCNACKNE